MLEKKSSKILISLGIVLNSTAIYANATAITVDSCSKLFIPCVPQQFELSVAAIGLKAGASNLNYVIYNKELPAQSPTWQEKELKPKFNWAFELDGRYRFLDGKDISIDWTHLDSSISATTVAPNASFFLGPDYQIGPQGLPIRNASGNVEFKYDVINLVAGQSINVGQCLQLRFFGGLSNAYLREQVNSHYSGNLLAGPFAGPFTLNQEVTANFTGIGPRFGIGADYTIGCGFGVFGESAASALIGYTHSITNFNSTSIELLDVYGQTRNHQFIKDEDVYQVVPGFDAKLGVNFNYAFNKCVTATVKLGYQAAVYVNAVSQYLPGTLVSIAPLSTGGIFVATMNHTLSNYSVHGPFLEAAIQF